VFNPKDSWIKNSNQGTIHKMDIDYLIFNLYTKKKRRPYEHKKTEI